MNNLRLPLSFQCGLINDWIVQFIWRKRDQTCYLYYLPTIFFFHYFPKVLIKIWHKFQFIFKQSRSNTINGRYIILCIDRIKIKGSSPIASLWISRQHARFHWKGLSIINLTLWLRICSDFWFTILNMSIKDKGTQLYLI